MEILNKQSTNYVSILGRLSDGSDRREVVSTKWQITVEDEEGNTHILAFDKEPRDEEILVKYNECISSLIVQEPVDEEKAFMAEAIIQMSSEIEELTNKINQLTGGN